MEDLTDEVFKLEYEFTNTINKFKEQYFLYQSHLENAIALYISKMQGKNYVNTSTLLMASTLLYLYEAFKCIKDKSGDILKHYNYCFGQERKQIAMNLHLNLFSVDTVMKNLEDMDFLTKQRKSKDGSLYIKWNFYQMRLMFNYLGETYLEEQKAAVTEYFESKNKVNP